jgi:hypothetical protein
MYGPEFHLHHQKMPQLYLFMSRFHLVYIPAAYFLNITPLLGARGSVVG